MRLINADEIQYTKDWVVTDKIPKVGGYKAKAIYRVTKEEIDAMPTVEAVPVRHGKWMLGVSLWYCSECGSSYSYGDYAFCPNCGADMRKEGEKDG